MGRGGARRPQPPVYLSEGLGHAFLALEDNSTVMYPCKTGYTADREHTINALDPALDITWPAGDDEPIISDRGSAADMGQHPGLHQRPVTADIALRVVVGGESQPSVQSRRKDRPTTGDVTLRQLRYFAVLGEELNYRRAAERLFITQPALSTAIKQLEHQLGVMLFTRTTREVALTELGQAWMPKVRDALRGIDAAVDDLIDLSAHYRRIRLGYLIGTGADLLFRLVRNFEAAYPEITLEPREFDFSDPTAGLADGTTEVAIIRPPVDLPEHRMFILDAEDWVACLPRDHPLAGRSELAIAELLDDPIVVAPATAGRWRDYWMAMDARGGKPPTIAAVAATYEEETTTIARGLGISFTSAASARLYNRQGIAYVPIVDRPRNYTALAWHPAGLSREAAELVRHVREQWSFGEGQAIERPATYY